jgi:hypothetical protein
MASDGAHTHTLANDGTSHGANGVNPSNNFYTSNGNQIDSGDVFTQTTSSSGSHTHTINSGGLHNHTLVSAGSHNHSISSDGSHTHTVSTASGHTHSITVDNSTGTETRPDNIALFYWIRY